jgi:hypothetical protein
MGPTDWFKRLFSSPPATGEDPATLRAEYGEGGLSGLVRVEDAKEAEDALEADESPSEPPSEPAP